MNQQDVKNVIEGALLCAGEALSLTRLMQLFSDEDKVNIPLVKSAIKQLEADYAGRALSLNEVASGFRLQVRNELTPWIARLWEHKPPRYSRALLETLSIIAYRQPATRGQVEEIRGVAVSSNIIKTLLDRDWIKVLGHRDVPGRPALYGTTKQFLDDFNLKSLSQLPTLKNLTDLDSLDEQLQVNLGFKSSDDDSAQTPPS